MTQHTTPEPLTMFDKIWMRHRVLEREDGQVLLYVDRHFIHDGTAPAFEMLRKRGAGVIFLSLLHGCWIMTELLFSSGTAIATSTLQKAPGQQQHGRIR